MKYVLKVKIRIIDITIKAITIVIYDNSKLVLKTKKTYENIYAI